MAESVPTIRRAMLAETPTALVQVTLMPAESKVTALIVSAGRSTWRVRGSIRGRGRRSSRPLISPKVSSPGTASTRSPASERIVTGSSDGCVRPVNPTRISRGSAGRKRAPSRGSTTSRGTPALQPVDDQGRRSPGRRVDHLGQLQGHLHGHRQLVGDDQGEAAALDHRPGELDAVVGELERRPARRAPPPGASIGGGGLPQAEAAQDEGDLEGVLRAQGDGLRPPPSRARSQEDGSRSPEILRPPRAKTADAGAPGVDAAHSPPSARCGPPVERGPAPGRRKPGAGRWRSQGQASRGHLEGLDPGQGQLQLEAGERGLLGDPDLLPQELLGQELPGVIGGRTISRPAIAISPRGAAKRAGSGVTARRPPTSDRPSRSLNSRSYRRAMLPSSRRAR